MPAGSDFLVIGAGIAGASAGYFLAPHGRVTVLEMEAAPGMHSTGRSAAVFSEYYGGPEVRELTAASRPFLAQHGLLAPRGVLALCPAGGEPVFELAFAAGLGCPVPVEEIHPADVTRLCPAVRAGWAVRAMVKPGVADIDVAGLHQVFLRGIRGHGGQVVTRARAELTFQRGHWQAGTWRAPIVVNAAGAWADVIAAGAGVAGCGLVPKRRTAFLAGAPGEPGWPMVADVLDTFYFKPESGKILVSPCDETPTAPGDARPEDTDVALGIERVNAATTLRLRHVHRAWAGLRTSAPDDVPVLGAAVDAAGFFWLAGLGGYGVQVAPAAGELLARLVLGTAPQRPALSPARLASSQASDGGLISASTLGDAEG